MSSPPDLGPLARVAQEAASEWGVELGRPFALSSYSFVAPAGDNAVLKVTPPEDDESDEEADALALWAGDGAVRLLRRDRKRRVLLLERARPGTDISDLPDREATAIAVDVGLRLWQCADQPFRWIGDHVPRWLDSAERSNQSARELIPLARKLYGSLSVGRATLVHGDFHHHNILDAGARYLAIDAKAMVGDAEFDVPSFLWNPLHHKMTFAVAERRLAAFAEAGLDDERMRIWAVIRGAYLGVDEDEARVLRALLG